MRLWDAAVDIYVYHFSGRKKKLSSYITFPEVLDMSAHLRPTSGCVVFYGVLVFLSYL